MLGPDEMKSNGDNTVIVATTDKDEQRTILGSQLKRKSWASRNRWLIIGASLLVIAVVAIGVSVGVTRSQDKKRKEPMPAPAAPSSKQAVSGEIYQLPSPEHYNPADWQGLVVDYYKQLNDSALLTPDNIKRFVAEARQILQDKFNLTLPEHLGSAKTILQYLQVSQQFEILDVIVNWARGQNLTSLQFDDLMTLAKKLQSAFNMNSMTQFNIGQSVAHEYVVGKSKAEGQPMSAQELLDGMEAQGFDMSGEANTTQGLIAPQKDGTGTRMKNSQPRKTNGTRKSGPPPPKPPPKRKPSPRKKGSKTKYKFPALTIPLVFHFLQYVSTAKSGNNAALPPTYDAIQAAQNIVNEVNKIYKLYGTNMQFRIGEVRTDIKKYPYLLLENLQEWQKVAAEGVQTKGVALLQSKNAPVDQYINVWIAGSFTVPQCPCQSQSGIDCGRGYGWVIPIDTCATTEAQKWQHVFIMHDEINLAWYNKNWGGYVPGAIVLAHELGHHLGLQHTHNGLNTFPYGCSSPNDQVLDTPENDDAQKQIWWDEADNACQDFLGGMNVDWTTTMRKFDSCPKAPGTDAIFNIMSYSPDSCRNSRHMALTPGQVLLMQMKMLQCRPRLVACASGANKKCYL